MKKFGLDFEESRCEIGKNYLSKIKKGENSIKNCLEYEVL